MDKFEEKRKSVKMLLDALKNDRSTEMAKHFGPKVDVHESEMVGEGHTPEEAVKDLHETHDTPEDGCEMCKGGIPMAEGGIVDSDVELPLPSLNDESEDEEDDMDDMAPSDVDNVPAIAALRKRKDRSTEI